MNLSKRSQQLQAAAVVGMQALAAERMARGAPLYPLVLGESDLATPQHIVAAGQQALAAGYTFYPPGPGYPELRAAIAAKLARANKLSVDPGTEIFVTNGSGLGLFLAILAAVDPGDDVLMSDPTYGPFFDALRLAGARPILVPQPLDDDGQPRWRATQLAAALTPSTKAIIINTPSAPAGTVLDHELDLIAEFALRHNLIIIADEVFESLLYDGRQHRSIAALGPEVAARTITVFSFSKSYAMTGWRLGYNVAPPQFVTAMERLSMTFGRPAAAFTQQAGIAALSGPQTFSAAMQADYAGRREQVAAQLAGIPGLRWQRPEGAFYYYLDFSAYGTDSTALAERLLREAGVLLTPGTFYGPAGQGYLRLSFAGPINNTLAGLAALQEALSRW
ncbi:MAG: aminotransferase class I/II-fold pyridoxal phosphate-dependent enzyme [Ardenticatenales bacterium]|nr:aminotransferase class I/II-fold pyridoxal phosphate-dependent enzyme [Ardenticatenales bacterium]